MRNSAQATASTFSFFIALACPASASLSEIPILSKSNAISASASNVSVDTLSSIPSPLAIAWSNAAAASGVSVSSILSPQIERILPPSTAKLTPLIPPD